MMKSFFVLLMVLGMKTMHKSTFVLFLLSGLLVSCIEEYKMSDIAKTIYEERLVIEGKILAGDKTVVYITRTVPIQTPEQPEGVLGARIKLIGQNGYQSDWAEYDIEHDRYVIPTFDLEDNTQYALHIEVEGETYQSNFQPILSTPEIEEVSIQEKDTGVSLHVSTTGKNNASRYYMWTYDEDWEIHSEVDFTKKVNGEWMYNQTTYPLPDNGENPYYYCWMHNVSSLIHIYSTENLENNIVNTLEFLFIPIDDVRISYIYSILVKQACLSYEAYEYYRLLALYTQESSGLFSPMPSEVKGNIQCLSNPKISVGGFVMASKIQTKRLFIYESDLKEIHSSYSNCASGLGEEQSENIFGGWKAAWTREVRDKGAIVYNEHAGVLANNSIIYPKECVDCRQIFGATKKRPDFWPTDHE